MIPGLFRDTTSRALRTALGGLQLRQQAIANNIANVDTPQFKAKEVRFEEQLANELTQPRRSDVKLLRLGLNTTHDRHFPVGPRTQTTQTRLEATDSPDGTLRNDGNTVDVEREMTKLAETQIVYNALGQIQAGRFGSIRTAINEGRR